LVPNPFARGPRARPRPEGADGLPALKDLIVDIEPIFAGYRSVLPYLINDSRASRTPSAFSRLRTAPVRRHRESILFDRF